MQNGVILNKLSRMELYLTRLEAVRPASLAEFRRDWKCQMVAERGLQILIEIMIDAANRLIALKGWGPVGSATEAMQLLAAKGAIRSDAPYAKMVRFRNFVVHDYDRVDEAVVFTILTRHLDDIRAFRDELLAFDT